MKLIKLFLVAFCFPLAAICQDITGLWTGTLFNDSTQQYYQYEVGISKENGKYSGFSHTWFLINEKKYYGVKKLKVKIAGDGKVIIEDGELLLNNYPVPQNKDVRQLNILTIASGNGNVELSGPFVTNRTKEFAPLTGHISLTRKGEYSQSDLVPHLQKIAAASELAYVKKESEGLVKNEKD